MRKMMMTIAAVGLMAATAAALCPPEKELANAAKTSDGSCCATTEAVAAKTTDGGSCCATTQTAVAAKVQDGAAVGGCCSTANAVAAKVQDGAAAGGCCSTANAVAAKVQDGTCSSCTGEAVAAVVGGDKAAFQIPAGMPMMTVVVGEKVAHCPLEGMKLAAETGEKAVYVVRGVQYDCPVSAGKVYARALEAYYLDITTPRLVVNGECVECPVTAAKVSKETGKPALVRVATVDFACPVQAQEVAAAAIKASDAVAMKVSVNGTDCQGCTQTAAKLSKDTGEPVVYSVSGVEVPCPVMAKCLATITKIQNAINAAKGVNAVEEKVLSSTN